MASARSSEPNPAAWPGNRRCTFEILKIAVGSSGDGGNLDLDSQSPRGPAAIESRGTRSSGSLGLSVY